MLFICAALSPFTTERQIVEMLNACRQEIIDWKRVALFGNRAAVSPALHVTLGNKGLLEMVPALYREYLSEMYRLNAERNRALRAQLRNVVTQLNSVGVVPVLLKGASALAADLFPDPGMRFLSDFDLLVPEDKLEDSVAALLADGYRIPDQFAEIDWSTAHHYAPLTRAGEPAAVELHRRALGKGVEFFDPERFRSDCQNVAATHLHNSSALIMSPTDELIHCVIHSELSHGNYLNGQIGLRSLLNFTYLCYRYGNEIQWERFEKLIADKEVGIVLESFLFRVAKLFYVPVPIQTDSEQHSARLDYLLYSLSGWGRFCYLVKRNLRDVSISFSSDSLLIKYHKECSPLMLLRLKNLLELLARYRNPKVLLRRLC